MSAEEFLKCLEVNRLAKCTRADMKRLAELAAPLSEAERRKLSKAVVEKSRTIVDYDFLRNGYTQYLDLAVLAVGPLSAVKKITSFYQYEDVAVRIFCDRRPDWADAWLAAQLSKEYPPLSWWMFRELLRAGVVAKPDSEHYVRFLASIYGMIDPLGQQPPIERSAYLQQNTEFIDDLWRLFEVETRVFSTMTDALVTRYEPFEDWGQTFLRLGELGLMDRRRLFEQTLRALGGDFSNQSLTGLVRIYEKLAPTDDDRLAAQPALCQLLTSRVSHVVTFALEQLADLQKAGVLAGAEFLAAAPQVFQLKPKGQPKTVLALTGKLAKDQPELITECVNLAAEALAHESSEVQAAAVKLLEGWQSRLHRDHASELRDKLAGLSATVSARVQTLIAALDPEGAADQSESSTAPDTSFLEPLQSRAAAIPAKWRSLAGVDDALAAATGDTFFSGIWFSVNHVPVLTSFAPLVPIATVDELLDAVAHSVERIDAADDVERILDGISRLCAERPADFEHRAQPLIKRLLAERPDFERGILGFHMTPKLPQLLFRWLGYDLANKPPEPIGRWLGRPVQVEDPRALTKFVERRLREIEIRVAVKKPAPLLCAPTHQQGWLDPRVFVERLRHYSSSSPPLADLVQALLRLAPDHREEALAAAADLPGEGAIIRFALGGPPPTAPIASEEAFSLWLAAARARQAHGPLVELVPAAGEARVPLLIEPMFPWSTADANITNRYVAGGSVCVRLDVEPKLSRAEANALRPTLAAREDNLNRWEDFGPEWSQVWLANLWPQNLDGFLVDGIRHLRNRVNAPASSLEPNHLYLQPLLATDRPWNELTWLALWIALVSKDAGARGLALDVLIAGIEDGRALLKLDVLLKLAAAEWFKLNRLADAAREVARVSPRHAWWCAELLQAFAAELTSWSSDIHHILALLLELLTQLQLSVSEQHRGRLAAQKSSGKSAKLHKALLDLQRSPSSAQRQRAHELGLEAALSRAERWGSADL